MSDGSRRFQRRIEDFECLHCLERVRGDGYTNHCPLCLWSRHVDVHPGDRAADCQGAMRPAAARLDSKKGMVILHRCLSCNHEHWNRSSPADDRAALTDLLASS